MSIEEKIDYLFSKINWAKSNLDAEAIHIMNNLKSDIKLGYADQQFTGWIENEFGRGYITDLIDSMGLTRLEWECLKSEGYISVDNLNKDLKDKIDTHFRRSVSE